MSEITLQELADKMGPLGERVHELTERLAASTENGESYAELKHNLDEAKAQLGPLVEDYSRRSREAEAAQAKAETDQMLQALRELRTPAKAGLIGNPSRGASEEAYFFTSVALARSRDFEDQRRGKAQLEEMGVLWSDPNPEAKATVGDTDAAGGYLVPNNVVLKIDEQATAQRSVVDLFTAINGVRGSGVDLPWEQEAISRAVIAAAGATKENSDFITNNYSATLYTLARIFDVGNQLLRQSQGAAEQLVRSKLARAFALGEDYYALQGTGSSQPYGLLTAIGTTGTYVTSHTASSSTVAGSVITAVLAAAGAIADRGGVPDGVVLNSADFYTMAQQGSDNAGFWRDPFAAIQSAGTDAPGPGGLRWRHSPNMPTDSLVVGEYANALFIRGQGYRVDTSDQAGTRWDKNLTGFRGEEEIAFDARPSVYTGHFQRIIDVVP